MKKPLTLLFAFICLTLLWWNYLGTQFLGWPVVDPLFETIVLPALIPVFCLLVYEIVKDIVLSLERVSQFGLVVARCMRAIESHDYIDKEAMKILRSAEEFGSDPGLAMLYTASDLHSLLRKTEDKIAHLEKFYRLKFGESLK